jgi:hypothetical protein
MWSTQTRLTLSSPVTKFELTLSRLPLRKSQLLNTDETQHFSEILSTYNAFRKIVVLLSALKLSESPKAFEGKYVTIINLPDYSTGYWIKLALNSWRAVVSDASNHHSNSTITKLRE